MIKKKNKLSTKTFAKIFKIKESSLPIVAKQVINNANFNYEIIKGKDRDTAILKVVKSLNSDLKISGPQRKLDWERGWDENLEEFKQSNDLNDLIPKFVKGTYIRFQGNYIEPESNSFETEFVIVLRYYLFDKYYKNISKLYEFGTGTGLNLVAATKIFPEMKLVGLDWANSSIDIISALKEKLKINVSGRRFDLFNPDDKYKLDEDCGILTVGTLEQLGENFKPFINYLLKNKPKICIHMETIYELYNPGDLLDYLAIKYLAIFKIS